MLLLTRRDVESLLDPDALVDALATAMADVSAGRASVPPRSFARAGDAGLLAAMPAFLPSARVLSAKLVTVFPGNAAAGLESHHALVAVFDPGTGVLLALIEGASLTAARTAAGSALATRLCAREDARVMAIVGTGVQARAHARAVRRVRPIAEIVVAGRSPEKARALAEGVGGTAAPTIADAVSAADVVCCCTHATEPVIRREWLRPGTHVNVVGFTAGHEIHPRVFAGALVVVESRAAAVGRYPDGAADLTAAVDDGLVTPEQIVEVGELVQGTRTGRADAGQITVYRSVGIAAQDAAAAGLVLAAARARGAGTEVAL